VSEYEHVGGAGNLRLKGSEISEMERKIAHGWTRRKEAEEEKEGAEENITFG
jgi:hypothetical protein